MLKLLVILGFVLISHSLPLISGGTDDEFAEFDDFIPPENDKHDKLSRDVKEQMNMQDELPKLVEADESKPVDSSSRDGDYKQDEEDEEVTKRESSKPMPDLKLVNAPSPRVYKLESYYVEFAFLLASFLYFVNYFVGSGKNLKFAQDWYEQAKEILKQQFSLVGGSPQLNDGSKKAGDDTDSDPSQTSTKKQRGLIKSTESVYTLWNSGRVGIDGLLVEINLIKRQDIFSMALNLLKPTKDCLVMRFLLNQEGYENFVFCIAHKTYASKIAHDMVDINTFCPKKKPMSQCGIESEKLFVMSELSDVSSFILDHKAEVFIKKYEQAINFIHITDQYSTSRSEDASSAQKLANSKRMATFSFAFPRTPQIWNDYILFSLSILDRLRRFKLARDSKQKSEKNRQKITDILQKTAFSQRQEAAQAKKEELRRLEKERIYNEDDPEKQRKWEKKEAKRELKKNKMRVKQLKVKSM